MTELLDRPNVARRRPGAHLTRVKRRIRVAEWIAVAGALVTIGAIFVLRPAYGIGFIASVVGMLGFIIAGFVLQIIGLFATAI